MVAERSDFGCRKIRLWLQKDLILVAEKTAPLGKYENRKVL
jgi:hypothetical protein